jgi:predicted HAD superfamily Cof-like phosphohydrolase
MDAFSQKRTTLPGIPELSIAKLRSDLIIEETEEFTKAVIHEKNIYDAADAIVDQLYVIFGNAHSLGLSEILEEMFDEVHRSNMTKLGNDGKPVYRKDGKVIKGLNFSKPELKNIIDRHIQKVNDSLQLKLNLKENNHSNE